VFPVKDDIPADRLPVLTLALQVACVIAAFAFGGALLTWLLVIVLLWFAGPSVEGALGSARFVALALCAGVIGYAVQLAIDGGAVDTALAAAAGIGAACAGAHLRLYPWARVQGVVFFPFLSTIVSVPMLALLVVWVALQAVFALLGWAHAPVGAEAAGVVFGALVAPLLARHVHTRDELLQRGRARTT
jgi:membrane associated rhomboid family serine protease